MTTTVKWAGEVTFIGRASSDHVTVMDGPAESGGRNLGPRPMEMLLLGLGACSAYDVVTTLKKMRQEIIDCEVEINSRRAQSAPKVFTDINMHFIVSGRSLSENKVDRAIQLSMDKYCSAAVMLGKTAAITCNFELIEPQRGSE